MARRREGKDALGREEKTKDRVEKQVVPRSILSQHQTIHQAHQLQSLHKKHRRPDSQGTTFKQILSTPIIYQQAFLASLHLLFTPSKLSRPQRNPSPPDRKEKPTLLKPYLFPKSYSYPRRCPV